MAEEPPPWDESLHSRNLVNTLMFGEGAISSSESSAADGFSLDPSPDLERPVPNNFFFFRELWTGEGSLPVVRSLFRPQETDVVRGSQIDCTCEEGAAHCSTIIQSGAGVGGVWTRRIFPWSGVLVRSGVLLCSGVLALSGVLDWFDVLPLSGFGDWPRPDQADHFVLFLRAWDKRGRSGIGVLSLSITLPDSYGFEVPAD